MNKKVQLVIGGAIAAAILIAVLYQGVESTVFFHTPGEVLAAPEEFQGRTIRIGARVEPGSTEWDAEAVRLRFRVTEDYQDYIQVVYEGVKPDLYRDGQGVVVEGRMDGAGIFRADTLLVKHSEEYTVENAADHKKQAYSTLYEE